LLGCVTDLLLLLLDTDCSDHYLVDGLNVIGQFDIDYSVVTYLFLYCAVTYERE